MFSFLMRRDFKMRNAFAESCRNNTQNFHLIFIIVDKMLLFK